MSDLEHFRDHCRERAVWQPGQPSALCGGRLLFGTPKPPEHDRCPGCGCECHAPTDADRELFTRLADEIDAYLSDDDVADADLFTVAPIGEATA